MMIYNYATFNHGLRTAERSAYRFSSFALMLFSISFARLGVLMYIFEVQGKVYRLGRIILLIVIVINVGSCSTYVLDLTYGFLVLLLGGIRYPRFYSYGLRGIEGYSSAYQMPAWDADCACIRCGRGYVSML